MGDELRAREFQLFAHCTGSGLSLQHELRVLDAAKIAKWPLAPLQFDLELAVKGGEPIDGNLYDNSVLGPLSAAPINQAMAGEIRVGSGDLEFLNALWEFAWAHAEEWKPLSTHGFHLSERRDGAAGEDLTLAKRRLGDDTLSTIVVLGAGFVRDLGADSWRMHLDEVAVNLGRGDADASSVNRALVRRLIDTHGYGAATEYLTAHEAGRNVTRSFRDLERTRVARVTSRLKELKLTVEDRLCDPVDLDEYPASDEFATAVLEFLSQLYLKRKLSLIVVATSGIANPESDLVVGDQTVELAKVRTNTTGEYDVQLPDRRVNHLRGNGVANGDELQREVPTVHTIYGNSTGLTSMLHEMEAFERLGREDPRRLFRRTDEKRSLFASRLNPVFLLGVSPRNREVHKMVARWRVGNGEGGAWVGDCFALFPEHDIDPGSRALLQALRCRIVCTRSGLAETLRELARSVGLPQVPRRVP